MLHQKAEQDNTVSNRIIKVQACEIAKVYDEIEEITGYNRNTIKEYKSVADRTSHARTDEASYSHHREVVSLPSEAQKILLQKSVDENLTKRELREEVQQFKI